jgi:hypothetical protein
MRTGISVGRYCAGVSLINNTIQYPVLGHGVSGALDLMKLGGYAGTVIGGYFEGKADATIRFLGTSKGWLVEAPYIGTLKANGESLSDVSESFIFDKQSSGNTIKVWDSSSNTWKTIVQ